MGLGSSNPGYDDDIRLRGNTDGTRIGNVGDKIATAAFIFDPETETPGLVTPAGALKVSEIVHLAGDAFGDGPLSGVKWTINTVNSATQLETGGELILATNGGADADVRVDTVSRGRFYPGHFNTAHIAAQLSSVWASTDTIAEWGAFDANDPVNGDGLFIRFFGGEFNIVTKRAGVENVVNEASFNGFIPVKNALTTVYEVGFNAGTARFYQGPNVFHVESAASGPYVSTPHLRVGARLYNINGSTESHDIRFRALGMYRVGRPFAVPDFIHIGAAGTFTIKDSPGTLHRIVLSRSGGGASLETIEFRDGPLGTSPLISVIAMESNDNKSHAFGHVFNDGLTVVLSSSQFDLTVVYD
jgi:hypothetical protein